jgi:hypothetical protein
MVQKSKKKSLGINKFEMALLLLTLRQQIKYAVDEKSNTIALRPLLQSLATFIEKAGKKAHKPWRPAFDEQGNALRQLSYVLDHGGIRMKKIELGITPKELMAMIPELIGEIWPHYNDDQKISVDEGVLIAAAIFEALADPTDDEYIKAFFEAQGAALRSLAPLFEEEDNE